MSEPVSRTTTGIQGGIATIFVSDISRAVAFYTDTLGFTIEYRAGDHFAMINAGSGFFVGLHPPSEQAAPPGTHGSIEIGFGLTRPIEEAVAELESRGVTFKAVDGKTIVDDGPVKLAFFTDPDGSALYLCETVKP